MRANRNTLTLAVMLAVGSLLAGLVAAPMPAAAMTPRLGDQGRVTTDVGFEMPCETFGDDGQHCGPGFSWEVQTQGFLSVRFEAARDGCSDFEVSFYHQRKGGLPFNTQPTSGGGFLAPGASSREVVLGESLTPGVYVVWVLAHGRPGGCNTGRLERWGGALYVTTSGPPLPPPPPAFPSLPTLRLGASGENVTTLQYLLRATGQPNLRVEVDGNFGPQTEQVVRTFQRQIARPEDGVVGPEVWEILFRTVRRGSEGDVVRAVQSQLASRGADVAVDGDFGPQTEEAVKAFQRSKGLAEDGIVGAPTWAALVAGN